MAIYGVNVYGSTTYGLTRLTQFSAGDMQVSPVDYDKLLVTWVVPGGGWSAMRLVRSSFGSPTTFDEGTTLFNVSNAAAPSQFLDLGPLREGHFYYYTLFVYSTADSQWVAAGNAVGLVTESYDYADRMWARLPAWYRSEDANNDDQLYRFLQLFGYEFDRLRTEGKTLESIGDIDRLSGALLPNVTTDLGVPYEPAMGMRQNRILAANALHILKTKGTTTGVEALASALTGYGASVIPGKNLMLSLSESSFENDLGSWVATVNCAVSHDVISAQDGTASMSITAAGNGDATVEFATTDRVHLGVPVDEGAVYTASLYAKQGA